MAPRLLSRLWPGFARGVCLAVVAVTGVFCARAEALEIVSAGFEDPTARYSHLVLGKDHNWDTLVLRLSDGTRARIRHEALVFEDTAPRLVDLDRDGLPEVLTVESGFGLGARLVIYGVRDGQVVQVAATPHIGQTNRWYAPVGVADLDGDGAMEVAFVDRPHLAKTLRIWRYRDGIFREVATLAGVTNHRIGEAFISGGIRECGDAPEIILATANWRGMTVLRFDGRAISSRSIEGDPTPDGFAQALSCP